MMLTVLTCWLGLGVWPGLGLSSCRPAYHRLLSRFDNPNPNPSATMLPSPQRLTTYDNLTLTLDEP